MTAKTSNPVTEASTESKPQPVELLSSDAARVYKHIHPALVLGIFYAVFSHTVSDPVTSLTYLLVPLATLQIAFCCICVPASSSDIKSINAQAAASGSKSSQQQRRKKPATWQADLTSKAIVCFALFSTEHHIDANMNYQPAILSTILSFFITSPPLLILAVLHGAPVTTHIPQTLLLATHLSLLSCVPLFYAHGVSSYRWRTLYSLLAPIDELMGAALGTIVGAWIGAIPIPLDWDREWQKWPVTVVTGAYMGWAVGGTLGGWSEVKGTHITFD